MIAEILYAQVDQEGRHQVILDGIVGHQKDGSAMSLDDQIIVVNGKTANINAQPAGTSVFNGRMVPPLGRSYLH